MLCQSHICLCPSKPVIRLQGKKSFPIDHKDHLLTIFLTYRYSMAPMLHYITGCFGCSHRNSSSNPPTTTALPPKSNNMSLLRKIGNTDVPAVGLGLMGVSLAYGKVGSDEERLKVCIPIFFMLQCLSITFPLRYWILHTRRAVLTGVSTHFLLHSHFRIDTVFKTLPTSMAILKTSLGNGWPRLASEARSS